MTYRLEQFIEKIKSPVVCVFDNKEIEYADGLSLSNEIFEKHWLVDYIEVRNNKLFLVMKLYPDTVCYDDNSSFFIQ